MQSAMPKVDSPKLGNEVKAAIRGVGRDKTEANQSAGLSGRMDIGHRRNSITAGATAGNPRSIKRCRAPSPISTASSSEMRSRPRYTMLGATGPKLTSR